MSMQDFNPHVENDPYVLRYHDTVKDKHYGVLFHGENSMLRFVKIDGGRGPLPQHLTGFFTDSKFCHEAWGRHMAAHDKPRALKVNNDASAGGEGEGNAEE